jgi:hypothetical protein
MAALSLTNLSPKVHHLFIIISAKGPTIYVKFWEKNSRFARQKINILTLVLSEKKILNETKKPYPPPFKLNGRSLSRDDNEQVVHLW